MKTITNYSIIRLLILVMGMGLLHQTTAQSITWHFEGEDGKGGVKIIESNSTVTATSVLLTDGTWVKGNIEKKEDYATHTYIRIKQGQTITEIDVYWKEKKLIQKFPSGKEKTYWLKKT